MYKVYIVSGAHLFLCPVMQNDIDTLDQFVIRFDPCGTTPEYQQVLETIMQDRHLQLPMNCDKALQLYGDLFDACQHM